MTTCIPIRDDAHWRQLRSAHIGGSEIAALFGECSYLTHLELWLAKRGEISGDIDENERMFWGKLIEEAVALGVANKKGWRVRNPKAYFICEDTFGMGCTPDRLIEDPATGRKGVLQIKNVDRLEFRKWEDGQPPMMYQLQVQHEIACVDVQWGVLAPLVGGNELHIFEYQRHDGAINKIKTAVNAFWESVRDGVQPKAVADDYEILRELYGAEGPTIDMTGDNELPQLCALAEAAGQRKKAAEKQEKQAKADILQRIGNAARAICAGFDIRKTTVSKKEFLVKATTYNKLTIKEIEA